jgi:hypothetical protein
VGKERKIRVGSTGGMILSIGCLEEDLYKQNLIGACN